MRVIPALFWIPALAPVARLFEFTAPDTSKPVNFSEPVVFKWDIPTGNPISRWGINLDLIDIRNVSTWTWDTPDWVAGVNNGSKQILYGGENNWFEVTLSQSQDSNDTLSGAVTETQKFEVEGYPNIKDPDSGAGATTPSLSLALAVGAMALIFSVAA